MTAIFSPVFGAGIVGRASMKLNSTTAMSCRISKTELRRLQGNLRFI